MYICEPIPATSSNDLMHYAEQFYFFYLRRVPEHSLATLCLKDFSCITNQGSECVKQKQISRRLHVRLV